MSLTFNVAEIDQGEPEAPATPDAVITAPTTATAGTAAIQEAADGPNIAQTGASGAVQGK
jgi:hypothetical protein